MGVYTRKDSPWFWLWLERPGARGLRERTDIRCDAVTASERKQARELAETIYRERMNQRVRREYDLPGGRPEIPFADYADWYDTHVIAHHKGADRERELLAQLRGTFNRSLLSEITKDAVREWMTGRRQGTLPSSKRPVTAGTVNREADLLKSMLREAVPTYLEASPIAHLKRLKGPLSDTRILTPREEARLLKVITDPRDTLLVIAALDTLQRLSSLLALQWQDDRGRYLVFRSMKGDVLHKAPISKRLRTQLDAVKKTLSRDERAPTDHVFAHRRTTETPAQQRNGIKMFLRHACARAQVAYGRHTGGITFHTLRHTGASRMIEAGVPVRTVQELGAWKDIRSLMRYTHPTDAAKRRAVNLIGRTPRVHGKR